MPALPFLSDGTTRVQILGSLAGQAYANVFHVLPASSPSTVTSAQTAAIATGVRAAYVTNMLPKQHSSFVLGTVRATCLQSDTAPVSEQTGSDNGGAAGTPYPNNVAMCISGKITRRYRGGHPRFYFGGLLSPNQADSRHWAGAYITQITSAWNNFVNATKAITASGMTGTNFVVVHYYKNGALQTSPTTDSINSWSIDARIDSQRRRLGKV